MKIAFLASEAAPYAKTGGLADVAGALPKYLAKAGHEVRVFLPLYREVRSKELVLRKVLNTRTLRWAGGDAVYSLWEEPISRATPYFVEKSDYFDRDHLYGTAAGDDPDNGERFAFFSRAVLDALKALNFAPDIVHANDWQTAPALAYLKSVLAGDPFFVNTRSVFTIHNLAYQGLFAKSVLARIGLPPALFHPDEMEFFGRVNYLKAGINYATAVNTVSPRYSREIQTLEYGCGLDGLLRHRRGVLSGILNGADYAAWNPELDREIVARFGPQDLSGKAACKKDLLDIFGLRRKDDDLPVIGIVSRLAEQKGLDILVEALGGLFPLGLRLVILGAGETRIQDALRTARSRYPSYFGLKIGFDEAIARKIYAGSDLFLIPSRYEPCGLTQMYALKYGSVPVVRATGGLDDSIEEFDPAAGTGNGFKFREAEPDALLEAVRKAVRTYSRKLDWERIVANGLACDFSWERTAAAYAELYERILPFTT